MTAVLIGGIIGMLITVALEALAIYLVLIRDKRELDKEEK